MDFAVNEVNDKCEGYPLGLLLSIFVVSAGSTFFQVQKYLEKRRFAQTEFFGKFTLFWIQIQVIWFAIQSLESLILMVFWCAPQNKADEEPLCLVFTVPKVLANDLTFLFIIFIYFYLYLEGRPTGKPDPKKRNAQEARTKRNSRIITCLAITISVIMIIILVICFWFAIFSTGIFKSDYMLHCFINGQAGSAYLDIYRLLGFYIPWTISIIFSLYFWCHIRHSQSVDSYLKCAPLLILGYNLVFAVIRFINLEQHQSGFLILNYLAFIIYYGQGIWDYIVMTLFQRPKEKDLLEVHDSLADSENA